MRLNKHHKHVILFTNRTWVERRSWRIVAAKGFPLWHQILWDLAHKEKPRCPINGLMEIPF